MAQTIDRLLTDHRRLRNVLGALGKKAAELTATQTQADTDHLYCILDYLAGYPDRVHHPLEDQVFDRMADAQLDAQQLEVVEQNRAQHGFLTAATSALKEQVDDWGNVDLTAFLADLEDYVSRQRKHMEFEEQSVFPLALEKLSAEDWQALDAQHGASADPLFDEADRSYSAIYPYLVVDPEESESNRSAEPLLRYLGATGANWP